MTLKRYKFDTLQSVWYCKTSNSGYSYRRGGVVLLWQWTVLWRVTPANKIVSDGLPSYFYRSLKIGYFNNQKLRVLQLTVTSNSNTDNVIRDDNVHYHYCPCSHLKIMGGGAAATLNCHLVRKSPPPKLCITTLTTAWTSAVTRWCHNIGCKCRMGENATVLSKSKLSSNKPCENQPMWQRVPASPVCHLHQSYCREWWQWNCTRSIWC